MVPMSTLTWLGVPGDERAWTALGFAVDGGGFTPLQPNKTNGLTAPSSIMIDKITTVHRSKLGQRIGKVSTTEMLQLQRGLLVYLGMTG